MSTHKDFSIIKEHLSRRSVKFFNLMIIKSIKEAILMGTHNIGFYEDLTKIIFELSSNIIKYAPYFFCCYDALLFVIVSVSLLIVFCPLT